MEHFSNYPLFGSGLGTHTTAFILAPSFDMTERLFFYAHSLWFTVLSELGFIGFVALLFVGYCFGRMMWTAGPSLFQRVPTSLFAMLIAFLIHATVETSRPRLILIAFVLVGCVVYLAEHDQNRSTEPATRSIKQWSVMGWPALLLILALGMWQDYRVHQVYSAGLESAEYTWCTR